MNRESPFLSREIQNGPPADKWRASAERLLRESPYANPEFALPQAMTAAGEEGDRATEAFDDEAEALAQQLEPQSLEAAPPEGESELSADRRSWIHALDRSALELVSDATVRRRYLEEIDWRNIEFPDHLPSGDNANDAIRSHWKLSDELFYAMSKVVPERRVHRHLKYRGEPSVVPVPGQTARKLYQEAADAFVRLRTAAATDGVTLHINSAFRSEAEQAAIRRKRKNAKAVAQGISPHTYGVTVDLRMSVTGLSVIEAGASTQEKMANVVRMYRSPVYKWMALRAREFGWYPYMREPWHWEYNPPGFADRYAQGKSASVDARVEVPIVAPGSPGPTSTELVRFAQRVLNAVQGEHLSDDGKFGALTRAALERFRTNNALGAGATLDGATELALAQRALEEIGQASLFAQVGTRDPKTNQAIASFKSARGLGVDSALDARTRLALTDALAKRTAALGREYEADFGYDNSESGDDHEGGEETEDGAQDEGEALELEDTSAGECRDTETFEGDPDAGEIEDELAADQREWVLALDRSALERLPDAGQRQRYLHDIDWSDVEFPGNVPKGEHVSDAIRAHWKLADGLFLAMAGVVPERRVPTSIRFRERPVVPIPQQTRHRLFAEARDAFVRARTAAAAEGVALVVTSSWRSSTHQASLSANQPNPNAVAKGKSAHMYGLAVDLQMSVPGLAIHEANTRTSEKMANLVRMYRSPVYKWMMSRGQEFGFFPYRREPWHWEYNPPGLKARFEGAGTSAAATATARVADGEFLGGKLTTFTAPTLGLRTAVFCPKSALGRQNVDVLFFAHGLLGGCPRPKQLPSGFITDAPFRLGQIVHASGRPIILVLPLLDWANPGGAVAFGKSHPRWHALAKPETLNAFLAEALAEVGRAQGAAAPAIDELVVAGHSRAYDFLEPLAAARAEPAMQQGALVHLRQVWAFDTTYAGQVQRWTDWLALNPSLRAAFFYRPHTQTEAVGNTFYAKRSAHLAVTKVPEQHCAVPGKRLPALLAAGAASAQASEEYEDEAEGCDCAKESEPEQLLEEESHEESEQELGSDLSERFTLDAFEPDTST